MKRNWHGLVNEIVQEVERECGFGEEPDIETPADLWHEAEPIIRRKVRAMRPETLGAIAALCRNPGIVHGRKQYLPAGAGGKQILRILAKTTLVIALWGLITERRRVRSAA